MKMTDQTAKHEKPGPVIARPEIVGPKIARPENAKTKSIYT